MHEAIGPLDNGRDGEGRGAAARGVDGQEDVLRVLRGVARAVMNWRRNALEHVLDVALGEGFLRAVGGNAEALAQPVHRQLSEQDDGWAMAAERTAWPDPLRTRTKGTLRMERCVGTPTRGSPARSFLTTSTWSKTTTSVSNTRCAWRSCTHLGAGKPSRHRSKLMTALFG